MSDGLMPDYVSSIQTNLAESESQTVTAQVHATISTYNSTTESFRDDPSWWDQYIEFDPEISIRTNDLSKNHSIGFLVTNFNVKSPRDKSWCFLGMAPSGPDDPSIRDTSQYSALEFNTRRDLCEVNWTVTKYTVELVSGYCSPGSLPYSDQIIFTNNSLAFVEYYMPTLSEFLGAVANVCDTPEWLYPTLTSAVAATCWSRMTALSGYYNRGPDKSLNPTNDPFHVQRGEVYYNVNDTIISTRITRSIIHIIPRASIPTRPRNDLIPCSSNLLPNTNGWRIQHDRRSSRCEERKPETPRRRFVERPPLQTREDENRCP